MLCVEMWLSADTAFQFLDRLSIGCSAEWSRALGLRTIFLNPFLDPALFPALSVPLSWKEETNIEQKWVSGPCCMIFPPEMPAEERVQNMSGLPKYRGREDMDTILVWTLDRYVQ